MLEVDASMAGFITLKFRGHHRQVRKKRLIFVKLCVVLINMICLNASGTSVLLAAQTAHIFSVKPAKHLMPSYHQLATISPSMNIIPSIPVKRPSDPASVSADTMMNSWKNPSHRKEVVFLSDISQLEDRNHFI